MNVSLKKSVVVFVLLLASCAFSTLFFFKYHPVTFKTILNLGQNNSATSSSQSAVSAPVVTRVAPTPSFDYLITLADEAILAEKNNVDAFSKTLSLLSYIQNNTDMVKKFLIDRESATQSSSGMDIYKTILTTYTLYQIEDSLTEAFKTYDPIRGNRPLLFHLYPIKSGAFVFILDNMYNSGAYNVSSDVYLVRVTDDVSVAKAPQIGFKDGLPVPEDNADNVSYSEARKQLVVVGFLPFGLYPCNEVAFYTFLEDRFVYEHSEQSAECLKQKEGYFDNPEVVSKALEANVDFSKMVVTKKTSEALFEKAKILSVKE